MQYVLRDQRGYTNYYKGVESMKIGMILDTEYPDDARITNQCDELTKYNHEVHLFCLSYKKSFVNNEIINKINVHRYYCNKLTYKLSALANDLSLYSIFLSKKILKFIKNSEF